MLFRSHPLYLGLGAKEEDRRATYRALFRAHLDDEALTVIRKATQCGLPLGNDRFREQVAAVLGRRVEMGKRGRRSGERNDAPLPGQLGLNL